jgi:serine O-acetyltransferase
MLWCLDGPEEISHSDSRSIALALAFAARRETGVEIHPGASLGANFVVDHGYGTVIGETVETGTDCYILNAVTLGSRGISGNRAGRRHPALGDRVEIGAFACVFGAVTIGDDVFIGPHCMISSDISPGMFVTVKQPISMRPHSANAPNRAFASPN